MSDKPPVKPPMRQKGRATALQRTTAQTAAQRKAAERHKAKQLEADEAKQLAQIVNLHIGGYSLAEIGAAIGATADDVDRLLSRDVSRYVRSQPALRAYVRNWVSERYGKLLSSVWTEANDKNHPEKLEHIDRAVKILDRMTRLHGAEAPIQKEITVESTPEAVQQLVHVLASTQGLGYDVDVFDYDSDTEDRGEPDEDTIYDAEVVETEPDEGDDDE